MIVLTGMHRSGTTFIGEAALNCKNISIFHEPFNRVYGMSDIPYDYLAGDYCYETEVLNYLNSIENRHSLSFQRHAPRDDLKKKIARYIVGGKTERQWYVERYRHMLRKDREIILKDPFLSLSTKLISNRPSSKVGFIVRHPGAVWMSIKNMNWSMDLSKFACDRFFEDELYIGASEVEKFSLVWNAINEHNYRYSLIAKDNYQFITHEDMCLNPLDVILNFFESLGLSFDSSLEEFVIASTSGSQVEKIPGKLHQMKRNSSSMVNSWRDKISFEDECVIKEICGSLVEDIYGKW